MNAQQNEPFDFGHGLALLSSSPDERNDLTVRLAQLPPAQRATCPKCAATTVQIVNVEKKTLGAAMLTEWLLDSTAAGVAAGSKTVLSNACVACGFQWLPGSLHEALARLVSGQFGEDIRQHVLAQFRRHDQALEQLKAESQRTLAILGAVVAIVAVGALVYSAYFSPAARARAADLRRTDSWVKCVLEEHPRNTAACGEPVARSSLNAWFEQHADVLANIPVRTKLEGMSIPFRD